MYWYNVYIVANVTIQKGINIGNNCVIGTGPVLIKSIPSNSLTVGVLYRVVSTIEGYYDKCKKGSLEETKEYVRCFCEQNGRNPVISEFGKILFSLLIGAI